jgi:hypothetical protein
MLSKIHLPWTKHVSVGYIHEGKNNYNLLVRVLEIILYVDPKTNIGL